MERPTPKLADLNTSMSNIYLNSATYLRYTVETQLVATVYLLTS